MRRLISRGLLTWALVSVLCFSLATDAEATKKTKRAGKSSGKVLASKSLFKGDEEQPPIVASPAHFETSTATSQVVHGPDGTKTVSKTFSSFKNSSSGGGRSRSSSSFRSFSSSSSSSSSSSQSSSSSSGGKSSSVPSGSSYNHSSASAMNSRAPNGSKDAKKSQKNVFEKQKLLQKSVSGADDQEKQSELDRQLQEAKAEKKEAEDVLKGIEAKFAELTARRDELLKQFNELHSAIEANKDDSTAEPKIAESKVLLAKFEELAKERRTLRKELHMWRQLTQHRQEVVDELTEKKKATSETVSTADARAVTATATETATEIVAETATFLQALFSETTTDSALTEAPTTKAWTAAEVEENSTITEKPLIVAVIYSKATSSVATDAEINPTLGDDAPTSVASVVAKDAVTTGTEQGTTVESEDVINFGKDLSASKREAKSEVTNASLPGPVTEEAVTKRASFSSDKANEPLVQGADNTSGTESNEASTKRPRKPLRTQPKDDDLVDYERKDKTNVRESEQIETKYNGERKDLPKNTKRFGFVGLKKKQLIGGSQEGYEPDQENSDDSKTFENKPEKEGDDAQTEDTEDGKPKSSQRGVLVSI